MSLFIVGVHASHMNGEDRIIFVSHSLEEASKVKLKYLHEYVYLYEVKLNTEYDTPCVTENGNIFCNQINVWFRV